MIGHCEDLHKLSAQLTKIMLQNRVLVVNLIREKHKSKYQQSQIDNIYSNSILDSRFCTRMALRPHHFKIIHSLLETSRIKGKNIENLDKHFDFSYYTRDT